MKTTLILISLLFISFTSASCTEHPPTTKEEVETSDFRIWSFGLVKEGAVLKHNFILKNETGKPLKIKDVSTSCGCTVSKVEKKTLLPGESILIPVKFDSKGYSGSIKQYVYVHTDNLDKPVLRFIIKAEVVKK